MADTITKQEPKLSVRKPGVWRNRWVSSERTFSYSLQREIAPCEEYLSAHQYSSAANAEAEGERDLRRYREINPTLEYLGPVFFPAGDDA